MNNARLERAPTKVIARGDNCLSGQVTHGAPFTSLLQSFFKHTIFHA
jgi:hypothetical protein